MAKKTALPFLMVGSEVGTLQRVLVHSPDSGLGKVVPSKAQDWLFEDIVHLETIRGSEYDYFTKTLLYFLDPDKVKGKLADIDAPAASRRFYKPEYPEFHASDKVIELQWLLADILINREIKLKLVASVCALEGITYANQMKMMEHDPATLAKIFISGSSDDNEMIFAPIPNFIFTRDIGIVINDHVLLNKPAKKARSREALLAKYIFHNHPVFSSYQRKIIELEDTHLHFLNPKEGEDKKVSLEGGDVMVVSAQHVLIGVSERTTWEAAYQASKILLNKKIVKKVSIVKIPKKRDYMHIDTVFTQVKRNVWVLLGHFSKKAIKRQKAGTIEKLLEDKSKKEDKILIIQFTEKTMDHPVIFDCLEELLEDISKKDLHCKGKVQFIYSGNNEFPYDSREQWTDSCNLLALREGVVVGYDRNDKTLDAFKKAGFSSIHVADLLQQFESGKLQPSKLENTFILMPSAELSRARGGFHCMSLPLLRAEIEPES